MASITFLGACREVGRSCFLVSDRQNTLLDCGMQFGVRDEPPAITKRQVRELDRVVISHAHLDHSGYSPALFEQGYSGSLLCTKPTRDIMQLLLADYLRLSVNKDFRPYAQKGVAKLLSKTEILGYSDAAHFVESGVRFENAGHILGSAQVALKYSGGTLCYSGDINLRATRLLDGATLGMAADTLIIESTYGGRGSRHPSAKEALRDFTGHLKRTLDAGGRVIIPSFAVGRGQEVLFTIESLMVSGAIPKVPIFLDGMVIKALRIYRHNAVDLKREVQLRILTSEDDPFKADNYRLPETKDRSDVAQAGSCVIIATSGMLNGGPILHYLDAFGDDPRNTIVLVGYQAEGTRGRQLADGAGELQIAPGKSIPIRAKVVQSHFSAHSDHDELVTYARSIEGLRKVYCVHGEGSKADELAADIEKYCNKGRGAHSPAVEAIVPELGQTHEL